MVNIWVRYTIDDDEDSWSPQIVLLCVWIDFLTNIYIYIYIYIYVRELIHWVSNYQHHLPTIFFNQIPEMRTTEGCCVLFWKILDAATYKKRQNNSHLLSITQTIQIIREGDVGYFERKKDELINDLVFHRRCPWCNGYRRRKWTQRHEFKSWTGLIPFHIALIPLGKVWIKLFSLQL